MPMTCQADLNISPISKLPPTQQRILVRALQNIWQTTRAQDTYSQILDGVPVPDLCANRSALLYLPQDHPAWTHHRRLCPGVRGRLREFNSEHALSDMKLDYHALSRFGDAAPDTPAFNTYLIELVARGIHQIAVDMYNWRPHFHVRDALGTWIPPSDDDLFWEFNPDGPLPTWFVLIWYKEIDMYPNGAADLAGYWAENMILGGVCLFDRLPARGGVDSDPADPVYFHSQYSRVTYRIYKLLGSQTQRLLNFYYADPGEEIDNPLPILGGDENDIRVDPEEPIAKTGIYRDIWERSPLPDDAYDRRTKDVVNIIDYPRLTGWSEASSRAARRREEIEDRLYPDRPPLP